MPWVRLDDAYFSNGKPRGIGGKKRLLHLASACWSSANLSDGKVPKSIVSLLLAQAEVPKSTVAALVECDLWHDQGDHYLIHDWQDYIKSKAQVLSERAAARERQAKSRRDTSRDTGSDSTRDSQPMSHPPRPDQSLKDLHPPTTESRCGLTGRAGEVLKVLLAVERSNSGPVKNRNAWERTVGERLMSEHGTRIERLTAEYPDAPPDVIAGQINGDSTSLRYYQRREPA